MQLVNVSDLKSALQQYIDPDGTIYDEEIAVYTNLLLEELAKVPMVTQVLFWDDQEGGDPALGLDLELYDRVEMLGTDESQGTVYNSSGSSYYGATRYQRKWYPVGQWVISLWFGGSPLNSAPGFYVIPVA
jgi:hypothetical protein